MSEQPGGGPIPDDVAEQIAAIVDEHIHLALTALTEPKDGTSGLLKEFQGNLRQAMIDAGWIKVPDPVDDGTAPGPIVDGPQGSAAEQAAALAAPAQPPEPAMGARDPAELDKPVEAPAT